MTFTQGYLQALQQVIGDLDAKKVEEWIQILKKAREKGQRLFIIGNGGSGAIASQIIPDFNKGAALYRMNEWDKAGEEFKNAGEKSAALRAQSLYNLGNSRFLKGDFAEASRAYQESLKLNPADEDARFNLQLALQFKKNPPPQKQKSDRDQKRGKGEKRKAKVEEDKEGKKENAKQILKSASEDPENKPTFRPGKDKKKKEYEEDW